MYTQFHGNTSCRWSNAGPRNGPGLIQSGRNRLTRVNSPEESP